MQLHNHEQKVNTKQLFKVKSLKPYFRNIGNTLNYSNAANRNEHAFQLFFVQLESIILLPNKELAYGQKRNTPLFVYGG